MGYALLTIAVVALLLSYSLTGWLLPLSMALPGDQSGLYALILAFVVMGFWQAVPGAVLLCYATLSPVVPLVSVWLAADRRKFGGLTLVLVLDLLFPAVLLLCNGRVGDLKLDPRLEGCPARSE